MTQVGYDSTDPSAIPPGTPSPAYAMGYVDGQWPSYGAMRSRFPTAVPVSITAIPGSPGAAQAQMADGEQGDYTPGEAANWAKARWNAGFVPAIYCSASNWTSYQLAVNNIGGLPEVDWMIAAYPGLGPVLYPMSPGHQWIDRGTYDEWVIEDGWIPGRSTTPPAPTPAPPISKEYKIMDSVVLSDGTIVSHAVGTNGHFYEITRKANTQGLTPVGNISIIDLTDFDPSLVIAQ